MGREGNIHRDNLLGKILRILCIDVNYDKTSIPRRRPTVEGG